MNSIYSKALKFHKRLRGKIDKKSYQKNLISSSNNATSCCFVAKPSQGV